MQKEFLRSGLIVLLIILLTGCGQNAGIDIVDGSLTAQEDRTMVSISIEIEPGMFGYWELYPEMHSVLIDNKGNEYSVLQKSADSNFSGKIKETGVYRGTLVFPRLGSDVNFMSLRIDNVLHYKPAGAMGSSYALEGIYSISFNFKLEKQEPVIEAGETYKSSKLIDEDKSIFSGVISDFNDKNYSDRDESEVRPTKTDENTEIRGIYKLESIIIEDEKGREFVY